MQHVVCLQNHTKCCLQQQLRFLHTKPLQIKTTQYYDKTTYKNKKTHFKALRQAALIQQSVWMFGKPFLCPFKSGPYRNQNASNERNPLSNDFMKQCVKPTDPLAATSCGISP